MEPNETIASIEDLYPHAPTRLKARFITESENPRKELKENFTSKELYDMLWGEGHADLSTKDERADRLVWLAAKWTDDWRHFD